METRQRALVVGVSGESFYGETDRHAHGLPTREEMQASNALLSWLFGHSLGVPIVTDPRVELDTVELRDGHGATVARMQLPTSAPGQPAPATTDQHPSPSPHPPPSAAPQSPATTDRPPATPEP